MKKIKLFLGSVMVNTSKKKGIHNIVGSIMVAIMVIVVFASVITAHITDSEAQSINKLETSELVDHNANNKSITEEASSIITSSINNMVEEIKLGSISENSGIDSLEVDTENLTLLTLSNPVALEDAPTLYTEKDYNSLLKIVEAEATGEDTIGRIMVANVVLNRVESSRFPDSIYDVIHQQDGGVYQFSPIKDGRYDSVTITKKTEDAVERALNGEDYSNGALFFVARSLASDNAVSWFDTNLRKVAVHGVHDFFAY